ncbi:MAG: hypothetical protein PVJ34_04990 [Anaerolineae bacterium]
MDDLTFEHRSDIIGELLVTVRARVRDGGGLLPLPRPTGEVPKE